MAAKEIVTFTDKCDVTKKLCLCMLMANSIDFRVYSDLFFKVWRPESDR